MCRQWHNMTPCNIFPVVGSYSMVITTVFTCSLADQLEYLVSRRSDCLWLARVKRYKPVKVRVAYADAIAWADSIVTLDELRNLAITFSTSTFELDEPVTVCSTLNSQGLSGRNFEIAQPFDRRGWQKYKAGRGISPRRVSSNDHYSACVLLNR